MSASNWAQCPRCVARRLADIDKRQADVDAMYGTVPVDEFDAARRELTDYCVKQAAQPPTFREDYEIFGAADGIVRVDYSGSCTKCGLSLNFNEERAIPGLDVKP